jgi:hypothetical protein
MSKFLQDALRASLESDVVQEGAIDASADLNDTIEQTLEATASEATDAGPSAADLKDQVDSTDNVASVLETIGDAAVSTPETTEQPLPDGQIENPAPNGEVVTSTGVAVPPSMESLAFALQSVLASHGVALAGPAMESGEGQAEAIARVAHTTAANLRAGLEVSLEDSTSDSIASLSKRSGSITATKKVLSQAIQKVTGLKSELDQHAVCLNQKGFYNFMHRDGEFVTDLANAFADDIKVLEALKAIVTKGATQYDHLTGSETDVEKFIQGIIATDLSGDMKQFEGTKLLGDKSLSLNEGVLVVETGDTKSDGSTRTTAETAKAVAYGYIVTGTIAAVAGLAVGSVIGAGVGAAVAAGKGVSLAVGAQLGGLVGGNVTSTAAAYVGIFKGIRGGLAKANLDAQGRNTNVPIEVADVVKFLKDAEAMCAMVNDLPALLNKVNDADKAARKYAKTIGVDAPAGTFDKLISAIGVRNQEGRKTTSGTANGTMVLNALNVNYLIYVSAAELLIAHLHNCTTAAMQIAQTLVKA